MKEGIKEELKGEMVGKKTGKEDFEKKVSQKEEPGKAKEKLNKENPEIFTEEIKEGLIEEIVNRYDGDPCMLIPMMQDIQAQYGYLPAGELRALSKKLNIPLSRVYSVATFYASFRYTPRGKHEVTLCMGTVCYLKGADRISKTVCEEHHIRHGGTTNDRLFTLNAVNCVGACALAPVMIVDGKYHDHVTPESALKMLKSLKKTEAPVSSVSTVLNGEKKALERPQKPEKEENKEKKEIKVNEKKGVGKKSGKKVGKKEEKVKAGKVKKYKGKIVSSRGEGNLKPPASGKLKEKEKGKLGK